jgi:hypothetical protein
MSRGSSRGSSSTTPPRAGSSSTTSPPPHVRVPRHVARLVAPLIVDYSASRRLVVDYFASAARPGASARRAGSSSTTSPTPRVWVPRHVAPLIVWLVVDYFAARPGASARRTTCRTAHHRLLRLVQACRRLLRLCRATGCLGTSRSSSRGSLRRSSSTTPPHACSSSTTSPTSRVRVPQHVARLVVDYSASRRLVVDYFAYAARPGASARRVAHLAARCRLLRLTQARRRLLRIRRASGCLGTLRGSSRGMSHDSSLTTPPRAGLSSTTSPTPRVRVPRHVARPVTRVIVTYSVRCEFILRPRWLYFSHAVRRDYLSRGNTGFTSSTPRAATTSSSGRIASTIHLKLVENGSHAPNI